MKTETNFMTLRGHKNPMLTPCNLCKMEFHTETYKTTRKNPC